MIRKLKSSNKADKLLLQFKAIERRFFIVRLVKVNEGVFERFKWEKTDLILARLVVLGTDLPEVCDLGG